MIKKKYKITRCLLIFASITLLLHADIAQAIDKGFYSANNIVYYDPEACGGGSSSNIGNLSGSSANGSTSGSMSIKLIAIKDPNKFAQAIDTWIGQKRSDSPLKGLGKYAVAGGQRAGINPVLVIVQSLMESTLGTAYQKSAPYVGYKNSYNGYGRTATNSQPHVGGSDRLYYKWDSWQESLYSTKSGVTDMYQYIAAQYKDKLNNFDAYMEMYAPSFENDTGGYKQNIVKWTSEIYKLAGDSIDPGKTGAASNTSVVSSSSGSTTCCATPSSSTSGASNGVPVSQKSIPGANQKVKAGQENVWGNVPKTATAPNFSASQFGGKQSGKKLVADKSDDPGESASNTPLTGSYGFAELAHNTALGGLPYFRKVKITNPATGITIIAQKLDWGGANETDGGLKRGVDLWWQTANALGYDPDKGVIPIIVQQAPDDAPVGPVSASSATTGDDAANTCSGDSATGTAGAAGKNGWDIKNMITYFQGDEPWKSTPYNGGTIGECGCAPTSMSMIVATLNNDKNITPKTMGDFFMTQGSKGGGGCGSNWVWESKASAFKSKYGITVQPIGTDLSKAKQALKSGSFVLTSVSGGGVFSSGGHLLVFRGVTDSGNILVANPNGRGKTQNTNTTGFTDAQIKQDLASMWIVSKGK